MEKFKRIINGITDYVAYGIVDPERIVPSEMLKYYPGAPEGTKVVDICWAKEIGGYTIIRLGSKHKRGTLVTEFEFNNWLSCLTDDEINSLMTFDEYSSFVQSAN